MEHRFIFFSFFLNSLFFAFSIVQQWNFENSAVNLLETKDKNCVDVMNEYNTENKIYVKLSKCLGIESGSVYYRKYLTVTYEGATVYNDHQVDFDKIGSYHRFESDNIICPKGKYHPHYDYSDTYSTLSLTSNQGFTDNGDWELKCINHEQGYFFVFYLMNKKSHLFYKKSGSKTWNNMVTFDEIYDVKIGSLISNYGYNWAYIVNDSSWLKLVGAKYEIKSDGVFRNDCGGQFTFRQARTTTRGCFDKEYDHYYYLTYTDTSDFACGFLIHQIL